MLSTILSYILLLSIVIFLFVSNGRLTRQNALLEKHVKDLQDLNRAVGPDQEQESSSEPEPSEAERAEKPFTVESIRTALRFNGFSPEVPDIHDPDTVYFKVDDVNCRVIAGHIPLLALEAGFKLEEPKEDLALLHRAAAEVTQNLFIGKAYVVGDGNGVVFSVEFFCESYMFFRNNLKQFLDILREADRRFYETLDFLRNKREEEQKAVFSGRSFMQDSSTSHKVQS